MSSAVAGNHLCAFSNREVELVLTVETLLVAVAFGAAVVGFWTAVRLPRLAPKSMRGLVLQLLVGWCVLQVTTPLLSRALQVIDPRSALMLVVFPSLVIVFASAAWVMMFFQNKLRPCLR